MNKITKKLLVLILTLCFVPAVSFAADSDKSGADTADTERIESTEAPSAEQAAIQKNQNMMLMTYLGIYDAKLLAGDSVSRGMFTQFTSVIMDMEEFSSDSASMYKDVPKTSSFYKYIGIMSDLGIIGGYGDGTFRPDEPIKAEHAVKVLMKAAGYSEFVTPGPNETSQYLSLAVTEGLLKGVDYNAGGDMNFNTCANLLKNFLEMHTVKISGGANTEFEKSDSTIMESKMKVGKTTGIVSDDGVSSLDGVTSVQSGEVLINDLILANPHNFTDLLGRKITAFYSLSDEFDAMLIYYFEDRNEQSAEFNSYDCDSFNNGVYTYYDQNGKKSSLRLSDNYVVIYNGVAVTTKEHWDKISMVPEMGSIRLLNNGQDGKYNVVFIEAYTNIIVDGFSESNKSVVDLISNKAYYFDEEDYNCLTFEDETGFDLTYDDIQRKGAVLSLFESVDKKTLRVVVSTKSVAGKVSTMDEDAITINGSIYEFAGNFKKMLDDGVVVNTGGNYTVYIDFTGKVTFVKSTDGEDGYKNGMILKYTADEDEEGWYTVKIYSDKVTKAYHLTSKTFVDGVKMKTKALAANCFDLSKNTSRVIRFTADEKDELKQVYTVGSDKLILSASVSGAKNSGIFRSFSANGKYYPYNTTAKLIAYSNLQDIEDVTEITTYDTVGQYKKDAGQNKNNAYYKYSFYKFNSESVFNDLIVVEGPYVKMDPAAVYENPTAFMIVKDITQVYDKESGEIKYCLTMFNGKSESVIYAAEDNNMRFGSKMIYDKNGELVEPGDIIRYVPNLEGEISANGFVVLYNKSADECVDPAKLGEEMGNSELTTSNETGFFVRCVDILDKEDTAVIFNFRGDATERILNMTGGNCKVFEYEVVAKTVEEKNISELYGSNSYGDGGQTCVLYKYDEVAYFVIYR